ncbi:S-methyl-5'-thioadenosine phosphorylase [Actinoplanes teichomyceticus]|uniref:Purine nucleoside phosphorylase n=1 Tax=Actinoplanes teichomyceticus TaxID=1867 RepID=A0A561VIN2_ACTTI|nr:S-methyl-5'-thioadenosine phosphorylase [Actinoplanes teichomyceticus]TWG11469.1 methylthioadenosine phosphorylase [Actinoplanes teichomyceticus]GIF15717.1 purine nucleoside phosphorylase [Actinoplanes teichomyceticus]
MSQAQASIALIGGTGFYRFIDSAGEVTVETPYGKPSAPISIAEVAGHSVAFLPRHGRNHDFLPSEVPYRANLWALKELGVRQVLAFNTVGSLQRDYRKGDFVLVDQFVDRTRRRQDTFFSGTQAAHISSATPYCARMREIAAKALTGADATVHPAGTVVVIEGPRFSTTAESRWFSQQGWHLVNMTQYPEVVLARELELCYANLSYITDYDVAAADVTDGERAEAVSHAGVLQAFSADSSRVMDIVQRIVGALPAQTDCGCQHALQGALT